jgi:hypothetical protein
MSKRPIPVVADDFTAVMTFLKGKGIVPANASAALLGHAKRIHGYTYTLIFWRFRIRNLPEHSKVFLEEIASDALQILPQALMGYAKTTKLLTRGIIENTLRHVYFSDHPIEYQRMNRDKKWYLSVSDLCEYAKVHPEFSVTERKFGAISQLTSLYSDLSGGVHGRTVGDLEMRTALGRIMYEEEAVGTEVENLRKCAEAVNFLLAIFHLPKVRLLAVEDQRVLLRGMPAVARSVWREHES